MYTRQIALTFVSGLAVYIVMAACSSSGSGELRGTEADGGSPSSSGGPVPNALADDLHKSGARLKTRFIEGKDGSKQFFGWHDSERNEACAFARHSGGSLICMPIVDPPPAVVANYHEASGCDSPLAAVPKTQAAQPGYATAPSGAGTKLFKIGTGLAHRPDLRRTA